MKKINIYMKHRSRGKNDRKKQPAKNKEEIRLTALDICPLRFQQ